MVEPSEGPSTPEAETLFPSIARLRTPRAAAVAGIVFALLLGTAYFLIRVSIPADPKADPTWLDSRQGSVTLALTLVPFAGIAFLWFIGVLRDRLGELEDRFFSTVFFGSGLMFLAMTFVSAALAGGIVATYAIQPTEMLDSGLYQFGRETMYRVANTYSLRMASVFMLSLGTIWLRTRTMPRWIVVGTYATAVGLMLTVSLSLWVTMVFPGWIFVISVYILVRNLLHPSPV